MRSRPPPALLALALALAALPVYAGKSTNPYCNMDQNTIDPKEDLCNPLRYIPSIPINATACALYFSAALIFLYHQLRHKPLYFLVLVIGTFCEGIGIALRLWFRTNVHSTGGYIAMYMFVVLSPCAFLAADYILLGRIVEHLNADRYLFIRPSRVSWIFVISDIITFLIQASGGGMSASDSLHDVGSRIFLIGLALQLASFFLFTCLWITFLYRVRKDALVWNHPGWKKLYFALGWTCICFLIRSVFRTIELSQGYVGYLATHEGFVAGLDTLPLFLGIMVYTVFWPPAILTPERRVPRSEVDHQEQYGENPSYTTMTDLNAGGKNMYSSEASVREPSA